jgi:hypothetical protein
MNNFNTLRQPSKEPSEFKMMSSNSSNHINVISPQSINPFKSVQNKNKKEYENVF